MRRMTMIELPRAQERASCYSNSIVRSLLDIMVVYAIRRSIARSGYAGLYVYYNYTEYGGQCTNTDEAELDYMPRFNSETEMRSVYYLVDKAIGVALDEFNILCLTRADVVLSFTGLLVNSTSFLLSMEVLDKES